MSAGARRAPRRLPPPDLPRASSVKLIGVGGVGGVVARYLAMFMASLRRDLRLVLIDGDHFEAKNESRMFFLESGNKAEVVRAELLPRFRDTSLCLLAVPEYVTPDSLGRLIHPGDHVFLAVDNHATRKLVDDHCATLDDVCLLSGGNDGVGEDGAGRFRRGTFGNAQVRWRRGGEDLTPSLQQRHPEIAQPADVRPDESCTQSVTAHPQLLFTNVTTAACMLNTWLLCLSGDALHYAELCFDTADALMRPTLRR